MSEWQPFVCPTQRSPAANIVRMELINTMEFWQLSKYRHIILVTVGDMYNEMLETKFNMYKIEWEATCCYISPIIH